MIAEKVETIDPFDFAQSRLSIAWPGGILFPRYNCRASASLAEPGFGRWSACPATADWLEERKLNPQLSNLGWAGLEPAANALKGRCSTIELPTRARERFLIQFERCCKNGSSWFPNDRATWEKKQ